jgi:hypothetical protein
MKRVCKASTPALSSYISLLGQVLWPILVAKKTGKVSAKLPASKKETQDGLLSNPSHWTVSPTKEAKFSKKMS